jgi:regulator of replication initiation timing
VKNRGISAVKDNENTPISVSLETLARHIAETPRGELAALRAAFERQISSIESRLEPRAYRPAIDATVKIISADISERIDELASELDTARAQVIDLQTQLRSSQQKAEALAVERLELQRRLKDVTAAKTVVDTQYQQLVAASQQLTDGLSRTLHAQREQIRPATAPIAKRSESADNASTENIAPAKRTLSVAPAAESPASAKKKPLQFSQPARDAKRVKIRRGTHLSVDGIPGELVDLSLGGAQAVLRQMVKPNQLVRLVLPTAAGQMICRARIVWVVYEQPGTSLSVYRLGVKFTDIDPKAVEDFMRDFSEESLPESHRSSGIA